MFSLAEFVINAMWNCSVDLLGKIVIFEPGIAFPLQTLARRSHDVIKDCVSQANIRLVRLLLLPVLDLGVSPLSWACPA